MLKRIDPLNSVLVSYLETIDTSVETGILLPHSFEKKSKKTKKPVVGSSDTKAKSSKKTKLVPVIEPELDQPKPVVSDTQVIENEIIPSKTGVFKRIKMKSKTKRRSLGTKMVLKPQVSHQGVIFREVPAPMSPSTKKRMAADMAKHISQKKKRKLIISSDSTTDYTKVILETLEGTLILDSSTIDTSVTQPPEVSIAKIVFVEARTSDITVNISDMVTRFVKLFESMSPQFTLLSEKEDKHFGDLLGLLKGLKELSIKPIPSSLITSEFLSHNFL
ncbi:unnamed protein product [Lactuca saligna]|uniref:Uncharacterized protein n=1 Tax=Lactuca saligna TaxID=75948 RepID=A0AA35UTS9_LACSI|nr:unnamed protein product [Lactuca saligna]